MDSALPDRITGISNKQLAASRRRSNRRTLATTGNWKPET